VTRPRKPLSRRRGPGRPSGERAGQGRAALLAAARELMAEKGLPGVTLREVAQRAGVQPALVSYYFGGKQGLLRAVVEHVSSRTLERIAAALAREGDAQERLRGLLRSLLVGLTEDPYGPRLIMEQVLFGDEQVLDEFVASFARPNLELLRGLLESGEKEGTLREVDPMFLIPQALGGCIFFFLAEPVLRRLFGIVKITPELAERFADHAVEVLLRGISTRAGAPG